MNNELISVIVPIYKVEQWLPQCIDSILAQTHKNLEIILVDDGSPDESGKICDDYAKKDSRVRVIHKKNGGQSTARNAALDVANGEYIGFVDGDDWIEPSMYEVLISHLKEYNAQIVQCGCYIWNNGQVQKDLECRQQILMSSDEVLDSLSSSSSLKEINTSVCNKLFSKDVINKTRFSPVRAYEDDEFVYRTVGASEKILFIPSWQYNYNQHDNSTMTASFSLNRIALVTIQKNICDYIKERRPQLFNEAQKVLCSRQFFILHCLYQNTQITESHKEARKMYDCIMMSYDDYMRNPQMGRNKIMLRVMKYFPMFIWRYLLQYRFK
jgi:glycosyltransferase involved in cell wall biosynthesis